jgi:uncharacterized protein YegP (UPF0339 family)
MSFYSTYATYTNTTSSNSTNSNTTTCTSTNRGTGSNTYSVPSLSNSYEIYRDPSTGLYRWRFWNSVGRSIVQSAGTYTSPDSCRDDINYVKNSDSFCIASGFAYLRRINCYVVYPNINFPGYYIYHLANSSMRVILKSIAVYSSATACYPDIQTLKNSDNFATVTR